MMQSERAGLLAIAETDQDPRVRVAAVNMLAGKEMLLRIIATNTEPLARLARAARQRRAGGRRLIRWPRAAGAGRPGRALRRGWGS